MAHAVPSNSSCSFWRNISQDPTSGVFLVHHKLHLCFEPFYLADLRKSVKSVVDSRLIRYEPELGGILAGYGRIAILQSKAEILFNLSDIHVDVEGDFFVFNPEIGKELIGFVNRKSDGHVGCLVHGLFNISLHKPARIAAKDWPGKSAKLNDKVRFRVKKVDLLSQVPYIEGIIVELIPQSNEEENSAARQRASSDSGVSVASEASILSTPEENMERKRSKLSLSQRINEANQSATSKHVTTPARKSNTTVDNQQMDAETRKRKISESSSLQDTPRNKKTKENTAKKDLNESTAVSNLVSNLFAVLPKSTPPIKKKKAESKSTPIEKDTEPETVNPSADLSKVKTELKKKKKNNEETIITPKKKAIRLDYDDESDNKSVSNEKKADTMKPSSPKKSKISEKVEEEPNQVETRNETPGKKKATSLKKLKETSNAEEVAETSTPKLAKNTPANKKSKEKEADEVKTPKSASKTKGTTKPKKDPASIKKAEDSNDDTDIQQVEEVDDDETEAYVRELAQRIQTKAKSTPKAKPKTPSKGAKSKLGAAAEVEETKLPSQEKASSPVKISSPKKVSKVVPAQKNVEDSSSEKDVSSSSKKQKMSSPLKKIKKEPSPEKIVATPLPSKNRAPSPEKTRSPEKILKAVIKEKISKKKTKSKGKTSKVAKPEAQSESDEGSDQESIIAKILKTVQPTGESTEKRKRKSKQN